MLLHHFQFYWNCTQIEYCLLCWCTTRFFSSALSNKSRCCAMKFFSTVSVGWNTITIIPTILKQYSAWSISPDTFFWSLKYRILKRFWYKKIMIKRFLSNFNELNWYKEIFQTMLIIQKCKSTKTGKTTKNEFFK